MKLSSKEIFTFLGCVGAIFIVAFLIFKLSLPKKIKDVVDNIKDNNSTSQKEENNNSNNNNNNNNGEGSNNSNTPGTNNGSNGGANNNPNNGGVVTKPVYLSSSEAMKIGKDLYSKAEIISFDLLSYSGFVFRNSDLEGYDTKIINFNSVVSSIYSNPSSLISGGMYYDGTNVYLKNSIRVKDYTFVSTDLMLTNIEETRITFNARSTYCEYDNDKCNQEQLIVFSYTQDKPFVIEKINDKWLITKFDIPY